MDTQPFEDVSTIKHGDSPASESLVNSRSETSKLKVWNIHDVRLVSGEVKKRPFPPVGNPLNGGE